MEHDETLEHELIQLVMEMRDRLARGKCMSMELSGIVKFEDPASTGYRLVMTYLRTTLGLADAEIFAAILAAGVSTLLDKIRKESGALNEVMKEFDQHVRPTNDHVVRSREARYN